MTRLHADLEAVAAQFEMALARRSSAECALHPGKHGGTDELRWNAQQIVAHLVLTYESTSDLLRKSIETGRMEERVPTLIQRFLQWLVIGRGFFPKGAKAPEFTLPEKLGWEEKAGAELVDELRAGLAELDRVLVECEAKFGRNPVGKHFVFGPLTAGQWRRFHRVHGLHHLKQLKAVLR